MLEITQTLMRCSAVSSSSSTSKDFNHATAIPEDSVTPCSGRGDCLNGTCLCEIRYAGDECASFNLPYHAGIYKIRLSIFSVQVILILSFFVVGVSSVFYFVAALSIVQLFICCVAEYQRSKQPSVLRAFRLTTQKLLYFVVFVAALLRGAYFTTPVSFLSSF